MRSTAVHLKRSQSCQESKCFIAWSCERDPLVTASGSNPDHHHAQKNHKSSINRGQSHATGIINVSSTGAVMLASSFKPKSKHKENIFIDAVTIKPISKDITEDATPDNRQEDCYRPTDITNSMTNDFVKNNIENECKHIMPQSLCKDCDENNTQTEYSSADSGDTVVENTPTTETVVSGEDSAGNHATFWNVSTVNVVLTTKVNRGSCKLVIRSSSESSWQRLSQPASETSDQPNPNIENKMLIEVNECISCDALPKLVKHECQFPVSKVRGRRKGRPQRLGKKWKPIREDIQLDFRISLFPRNISASDDLEELDDIWKNLEEFQQSLDYSEDTKSRNSTENEPCRSDVRQTGSEIAGNDQLCSCNDQLCSCNDQLCSCTDVQNCDNPDHYTEKTTVAKSGLQQFQTTSTKDDGFYNDYYYDISSFYHDKLASESYLPGCQKLRAKKKWKRTKAHVQVKSKHCRTVGNSVHGQEIYINFRVLQRMHMEIRPKSFNPSNNTLSLRMIDKSKGFSSSDGVKIRRKERCSTSRNRTGTTATRSRFAMDAHNADGDLSGDLVNVLMNLQNRDLLPEDYELLLRLDERVAPKTIDSSILAAMKTEVVDQDTTRPAEVCTICMEPYETGQAIKYLPCGHCYHGTCIDMWLTNSSQNCPLDGVPIDPL